MNSAGFNNSYQGTPPWEIDAPQPAVMALAEQGQFAGRVLDVGCGTGENALHLASRGHPVVGVDGAPAAIERAQHKATRRDLSVQFVVADVFELGTLGQQFDTVLDSAFLHIPGNTAARRRVYTEQLATVLAPNGWAHLLEISEEVTEHPSLTSTEILDSFDDHWGNERVREAAYAITSGDLPAWLVSIQRR